MKFTDLQKNLINVESSAFFQACPGAGKTSTIVERFRKRPAMVNPNKGIALITFTNAAAENAKSKLVSDPSLLQAPNFVGTIDSFANRFITRPVFKKKYGKNPTFIESWSSLNIEEIRVPGREKFGVSLDDFRLDKSVGAILHENSKATGKLSQLELEQICGIAGRKIRELYRASYVSSDLSRQMAACPKSFKAMGALLAARFEEVIVDEVQDCSELDLSILKGLKDAGVRLIAVGDLDQSIYAFREAKPDKVRAFFRPMMNDAWKLTDNFRSTQPICDFTATMRIGSVPDRACGENAKVTTPVYLASFSDLNEVLPIVSTITEDEKIESKTLFLAHDGDVSRKALGMPERTKSQSKHSVIRFAKHFEVLTNLEASPIDRYRALKGCVRLIQDVQVDETVRNLDPEGFERHLGSDGYDPKELCLKLAFTVGSPAQHDGRSFKDALVRAMGELRIPFSKSKLRKPADDIWRSAFYDQVVFNDGFRASNIHQYKGLEAESVALIIPKRQKQKDTINSWVRRDSIEPLRVLYVGASRAQRLLMVFVHDTLVEPIASHMAELGVKVVQPRT